jgi:predicted phage terminase large subunit-like protein
MVAVNPRSMPPGTTPELVDAVLKARLLHDFLFFTRWFFKILTGRKFMVASHHRRIAEVLTKVAKGEITRLIINIPPRYGKTELAVKMFIAWCLANNAGAKFIHLSYSDDLALDNSSDIKELIEHPEYVRLFGVQIKKDSKSKKKWWTQQKGGVMATSSGGAVTGFGAGSTGPRERLGTGCPADGFAGAMIIDDPLKPDDAFSEPARLRVNRRFSNTFSSRLNSQETPMIVIMQRLHTEDPTGFLLNGGTGEKWEHLCLSAITEDDEALWPEKHTLQKLREMEAADSYTFAGQYRQSPTLIGGNIFKSGWIQYWLPSEAPTKFDRLIQSWDCTFKGGKKNDYVVGQIWGRYKGSFYLLDQVRGQMSFTETRAAIAALTAKWPKATTKYVEDKANGSAIVDSLNGLIPGIIPVDPGSNSKEARAHAITPLWAAGNVFIPHPSMFPWVKDYELELKAFPSAPHDDQVDATTQALEQLMTANYDEGRWSI